MKPTPLPELVTRECLDSAGRLISLAKFPPDMRITSPSQAIGRLEEARANIDKALAACRAANEAGDSDG